MKPGAKKLVGEPRRDSQGRTRDEMVNDTARRRAFEDVAVHGLGHAIGMDDGQASAFLIGLEMMAAAALLDPNLPSEVSNLVIRKSEQAEACQAGLHNIRACLDQAAEIAQQEEARTDILHAVEDRDDLIQSIAGLMQIVLPNPKEVN